MGALFLRRAFKPGTAQRLMIVAADYRLSNAAHGQLYLKTVALPRAIRRIGELSAELEKQDHNESGRFASGGKTVALKAAGLSTSVAHRCEKIAQKRGDFFPLNIRMDNASV